jgi:hypothetical protein
MRDRLEKNELGTLFKALKQFGFKNRFMWKLTVQPAHLQQFFQLGEPLLP